MSRLPELSVWVCSTVCVCASAGNRDRLDRPRSRCGLKHVRIISKRNLSGCFSSTVNYISVSESRYSFSYYERFTVGDRCRRLLGGIFPKIFIDARKMGSTPIYLHKVIAKYPNVFL